jgi:2-polyprenyl-3-methyl-5-hydroxy-6-metoxy-1,4-benzoquinol methylase
MTLSREAWQNVNRLERPDGFTLGPVNAETFLRDPKHMGFMLARYKFAAKMLRRCRSVLEVGCGEGLGALMLVRDTGARVTGTDFDPEQIRYAQEQVAPHGGGRLEFRCMDLAELDPGAARYDGLLSIDVIEHVHPREEAAFLAHCAGALVPGGLAVIGTPNIATDAFASPPSRAGHINLFSHDRFSATLENHFAHVFLFSMNDEVVHTGFYPMAHYYLALCVKAGA